MILYLPDITRYLTKAQCKRLRLCEDNEVYKEFAWYLEELCVSLGVRSDQNTQALKVRFNSASQRLIIVLEHSVWDILFMQ